MKPTEILYLSKTRCYGRLGSLILSVECDYHAIKQDKRIFDRVWLDHFGTSLNGIGYLWEHLGVRPVDQPPRVEWMVHEPYQWDIDVDATINYNKFLVMQSINHRVRLLDMDIKCLCTRLSNKLVLPKD